MGWIFFGLLDRLTQISFRLPLIILATSNLQPTVVITTPEYYRCSMNTALHVFKSLPINKWPHCISLNGVTMEHEIYFFLTLLGLEEVGSTRNLSNRLFLSSFFLSEFILAFCHDAGLFNFASLSITIDNNKIPLKKGFHSTDQFFVSLPPLGGFFSFTKKHRDTWIILVIISHRHGPWNLWIE